MSTLTATKVPLWTMESFYEEFSAAFAGIAKRANWAGSGSDDLDLEQWLWMHFFEIWDKAQFWERGLVLTHARRSANSQSRQERIDYENFKATFIYTNQLVDAYLREAVWCEPEDSPDMIARADISKAFQYLNKNRKQILFRAYALGEVFDPGSPERKTKDRAVQEIAEWLNMSMPTPVLGEDQQ